MSVCVCAVLCSGSGLETGWSPTRGVLPTVYRINKLKKRPGHNKGLYSLYRYIIQSFVALYTRCYWHEINNKYIFSNCMITNAAQKQGLFFLTLLNNKGFRAEGVVYENEISRSQHWKCLVYRSLRQLYVFLSLYVMVFMVYMLGGVYEAVHHSVCVCACELMT
jgi:hypothetical protein